MAVSFLSFNPQVPRIMRKVLERNDAYMEQLRGAEADAAFDGGEWSGPHHANVLCQMFDDIVARVADQLHVPFEYIIEQLHMADVVNEYRHLTSGRAK